MLLFIMFYFSVVFVYDNEINFILEVIFKVDYIYGFVESKLLEIVVSVKCKCFVI